MPISSAAPGGPLAAECGHDTMRRGRAVRSRSVTEPEPVLREVLSFETLPLGQKGSRRAVVRWSDGRIAEALRWWDDLCVHPHKSACAETCVMPRELRIRRGRRRRTRKLRI